MPAYFLNLAVDGFECSDSRLASLPPGNFIGDVVGPGFCLSASGLKMEETGCSETTIQAYYVTRRHIPVEVNYSLP